MTLLRFFCAGFFSKKVPPAFSLIFRYTKSNISADEKIKEEKVLWHRNHSTKYKT